MRLSVCGWEEHHPGFWPGSGFGPTTSSTQMKMRFKNLWKTIWPAKNRNELHSKCNSV